MITDTPQLLPAHKAQPQLAPFTKGFWAMRMGGTGATSPFLMLTVMMEDAPFHKCYTQSGIRVG